MFHAIWEYFFFHTTFYHRINILDCRQWSYFICSVYDIYVNLRKPPSADQSGLNKFSHSISHILNRNVRINTMKIIQINIICLQTFHGTLQMFSDRLFQTLVLRFCCIQMQFCCQHDIFTEIFHCFSNDFLIVSFILR